MKNHGTSLTCLSGRRKREHLSITINTMKSICLISLLVFLAPAFGQKTKVRFTTYHVNTAKGNDQAAGTPNAPFKTIQKAANVAQPGDTVLVYAGVYRERVIPPRGGSDEDHRIVYKAKLGDKVIISGLDPWNPSWSKEGNLHYATPASTMFTDSNYVDGGNPFRIAYMSPKEYSLGQVVVDGVEYKEQVSRAAADSLRESWWSDQTTGTVYIHFDGDPATKKVEIVTRRGLFRPYHRGLGYITLQGFELSYCGNNASSPSILEGLNPYYQSGMIGTRQGHHWKIINNIIRHAKGLGISLSLGTDIDDGSWWDPHGLLFNKVQVEVDYPKLGWADNETGPAATQKTPEPYKQVGFNLIANNRFEDIGMDAITGIGSVGNTIYGNYFSHCAYLIHESTAEDATIKMHMQYGTLIEANLFENFPQDTRVVWMDNNNPATRIRRNVFVSHQGKTPTVFLEITSSLDQYLTVLDNNLFLNCSHGVVSAAADGVAFYHNLFYRCGDGFSMGSRRDQSGSDYGNMRIHNWNNLFVGMERAFGFAYNQATNHHTSDYNLVLRPAGVPFAKYLLSDHGTGEGHGGRPGVVYYSLAQISAAKNGGSYWKDSANWGANNGPNGCEADLGYWRGTMGADIDKHSEERNFLAASTQGRTINFKLGSSPRLSDAPVKSGATIDFWGRTIKSVPAAGPFQDLTAAAKTYTFWNDDKLPVLPALPAAPTNVTVSIQSDSSMKVIWKNRAPEASFMYVERSTNHGPWTFWGYITTTQETMLDYNLPVRKNTYEYRVAARNAAGLSAFAYASKKTALTPAQRARN